MRILAVTLLMSAALAGCTAETPDHDYDLTASGVPADAVAGEAFTFTLVVEGGSPFESDHVGAHWWTSTTSDATGALGDSTGCDHQAGGLPGTFTVTCTIHQVGTVYLRGHARATEGETKYESWTEEHTVTVSPPSDAYVLVTEGVPANATVGEPFSFTVRASGDTKADSDHLGAHMWFGQTPQDPTGQIADAAGCEHTVGALAGSWEVTCTLQDAGTVFVLGHARVTVDGVKHDYWTTAHEVQVE